MNHYEALGVPEGAAVARIRAAYLALAREHHPDFHADDPAEVREAHAARMKAVTAAWDVLGHTESRARYDEQLLRLQAGTDRPGAGERVRSHPSAPAAPAGKGWTPRPGDDGWMADRESWAEERDRLVPDEDEPTGGRRPFMVVPVALFAGAVMAGFLGLVLTSRPLVAVALAGVVLSSILFMVLPLLEMTRRRPDRGEPSATSRRTPYDRA